MALLNDEIARQQDGKIELRAQPLRIQWTFADLTTADGHRLQCVFSASVAALDEPVERQMLAEAFLGRKSSLAIQDVVTHFDPALHAAANQAALVRKVATWVEGDGRDVMLQALEKEAKRVAFACGLNVMPPLHVNLESASFTQQKIEAMGRELAEQRVAGQVEHLEHAAALLKQFEDLRKAAPQLSPGAILEQIGPAERGTMLQTLLLSASRSATPRLLWAVAGPYLIRIDPRSAPSKADLIPLPPALGPLRSVQADHIDDRPVLLVGARGGIIIVEPDAAGSGAQPRLYADGELVSQLGFSKAVIWNSELWACHSDGGIVAWQLQQPDQPLATLRPTHLAQAAGSTPAPIPALPRTPPPLPSLRQPPPLPSQAAPSLPYIQPIHHQGARHLTALDAGRLACTFAGRLLTINRQKELVLLPLDSANEVVSLIADTQRILITHEDGIISIRDRQTLHVCSQEHRHMRIVAAAALPWLGGMRLLLAGEDGPIQCLGLDDALITQYISPQRGPRLVAGTDDIVAAVSADRQRLVLWNSWDGRRISGELSLAAMARHRIADLTFA